MGSASVGNGEGKMTESRTWQPAFTLTHSMVSKLTQIEATRVVVESTLLPTPLLAELSRQARVRATHYSTRIEGNRLTLEEAEQVIADRRRAFHGREQDVAEVRNYWEALARVEEWAAQNRAVTEELIQRIAGIAIHGKRAKAASYRTGQNAIRDSATGVLVYLPPEASDVPALMAAMVNWIHQAERETISPVVIAGLAHYQFVTIHPYYDGNGRTARLLATFLLHRGGYGLRGLFSLEEHHSRDIMAYYHALEAGGHHNYYMGRADADLTGWLEYFVSTVSAVFEAAKQEALKHAEAVPAPEPDQLRRLDRRARLVLALFLHQEHITSGEVAQTLGLSERMARVLLAEWLAAGWLTLADPSRKGRKYALVDDFRRYLDGAA
jgi:Fic family protein